MEKLGICMNLDGTQHSQWANYNFNSFCTFNGQPLGANDNGIFKLEDGDFDYSSASDYDEIDAYIELPTSDWGVDNQKRIRSVHLGLEADGDMLLTLTDDEGRSHEYTIEPSMFDNKQNGVMVKAGRNYGKGRYWRVRLDNVNGADFGLNTIRIYPVVLGTRPGRS